MPEQVGNPPGQNGGFAAPRPRHNEQWTRLMDDRFLLGRIEVLEKPLCLHEESVSMILGYDEAGSGPVLILVHGFPFDRTMWADQVSGLSDVRRVIAVDLRGRGRGPDGSRAGWSMDDLADDIAQTIDSIGVDKVDLAGLSMGGYVLFAFWRRHRERVKSLILIDTKASDDASEAKAAREKAADLATEGGTSALFADLGPKLTAPGATGKVVDRLKKMFGGIPGEASAADALAMRDRPDSTPDLAAITVPVLVLHGEQDQLMPLAVGEELASQIPGARMVSIPNAGHVSPMENPEAVNAAIREFLTPIR